MERIVRRRSKLLTIKLAQDERRKIEKEKNLNATHRKPILFDSDFNYNNTFLHHTLLHHRPITLRLTDILKSTQS